MTLIALLFTFVVFQIIRMAMKLYSILKLKKRLDIVVSGHSSETIDDIHNDLLRLESVKWYQLP